MAINQPRNYGGLTWNTGFANRINEVIARRQRHIDAEVLRLCEPLTPRDTGALINSGKMGTVVGSGEIQYLAVYAKAQYYNTAYSHPGSPDRGAHWFDRMKVAHREAILRGVQKIK